MKYSPKLKAATEEIKDILKKYDIAGIVFLHDIGFGEYLVKINPTYSCAYVDEALGALRVKAKASELLGGAEERNQKLKDTSNMLHIFSGMGNMIMEGVMQLSKSVDEQCNAEHFGDGHSTHQSQNN